MKALKTISASLLIIVMLFAMSACGSSGGSGGGEITSLGTFKTIDAEGNEVTSDIFADAGLTMINYWATFCGPCREEMPELETLRNDYDGLQIIGVPVDVYDFDETDDNYQLMLDIISDTGVTYPNLFMTGSLYTYGQTVYAVPTTIFVDKDGNIVDTVMGADIDRYRRVIAANLE